MTQNSSSIANQAATFTDETPAVTLSDGTQVKVYKCKVKQIGLVLSLATSIFNELGFKDIDDPEALQELARRTSDPGYLLQLISKYSDEVISLASELCSLDKETFDDMELDDAILVIEKVWEVNKDFFYQRVLPLLGLSAEEPSDSQE